MNSFEFDEGYTTLINSNTFGWKNFYVQNGLGLELGVGCRSEAPFFKNSLRNA